MNKFLFAAAKKMLNIYLYPLKILAHFGIRDTVLDNVCQNLDGKDMYVYYRIFPKYTSDIPVKSIYNSAEQLAILLQGPICYIDNMTFESVKFYKNTYKNSKIIVSTWDDEKENALKKLEKMGAIVVKSPKPSKSGVLNVNYQVVNTLAGIKKAKELGVQYIAKTRTDQRICKPFVLNSIWTMTEAFPPENDKQRRRITALPGHYGNMFLPYFMSDFFYFGHIDDIEKLFSVKPDERDAFKMPDNATKRDYAEKMYPPEVYLLRNYAVSYLGSSGECTVKEHWNILKNYFICLDKSMVDIFTPKYDYCRSENIGHGLYFKQDNEEHNETMGFGYANWLNLYSGKLNYSAEYEKKADVAFFR